MALEGKEIIAYLRRGLLYAIRFSFNLPSDHPFVCTFVFFLLLLYRFFPFLFALLVSSSPILICTSILLSILLSYGEQNLLGIEEDKKVQEIAAQKAESSATNFIVKKDGSIMLEAPVGERAVVTAALYERTNTATASVEEAYKEIHNKEKKPQGQRLSRTGGAVAGVSTTDKKKTKDLKVEMDNPALDNCFGSSSLSSPWHPVDTKNACSDSESDQVECSSPDTSITDIVPMLDELDPLLDTEIPQPAHKSVDHSDSASEEDHEFDGGSAMEEENSQEDEEDVMEEEKDDANEEVVKWTAADQKNLMDLGTSEIERNLRLEKLIAKRRSTKSMKYEIENNLIDLDSNDPVPIVGQLSSFDVHIPPISATRQNPFDLPFESEEAMGLPPVPGSAPSVLLPRLNPFDLPYDQVPQNGSLLTGSMNHPELTPVPPREPFFCRHESFSLGASSSREFKQEKLDSRLKPFFVAERVQETGFPTLPIKLTDKSNSKVSSAAESCKVSSVVDEDHHKELLEEGLHQESKLLSAADHDAEPVKQESDSSEEVDSVDADHEQSENTVSGLCEINLTTSMVTGETHWAASEGHDLTISNTAKLEVNEDKYDESSSSSSSDVSKNCSSIYQGSADMEITRGDSTKVYCDHIHSRPADSKFPRRAGERVDDDQVADPVYDSSPSSSEKPLNEYLFHAGERSLNSSSSLASDMQANNSGVVPSPMPPEENISSTNEDFALASGGVWVASPSLSSVDEIECRSREINEIREHDVLHVGLPRVSEDFVRPVALVMPRTVSGRILPPSSLSSVETESSEDSS